MSRENVVVGGTLIDHSTIKPFQYQGNGSDDHFEDEEINGTDKKRSGNSTNHLVKKKKSRRTEESEIGKKRVADGLTINTAHSEERESDESSESSQDGVHKRKKRSGSIDSDFGGKTTPYINRAGYEYRTALGNHSPIEQYSSVSSSDSKVTTFESRVMKVSIGREAQSQMNKLGSSFAGLLASSKRYATDAYDHNIAALSAFLRSEHERYPDMLLQRLLQEPDLLKLVNDSKDSDMDQHLQDLNKLVEGRDEILALVIDNFIFPKSAKSTPAGNSYSQDDIVESLSYLRAVEEILARAMLAIRERHINFIPQIVHGIYAQQKSILSKSSRGAHSNLNPHTENAYDATEDIPQGFSLVCARRGKNTTPTHIIAADEVLKDMAWLRKRVENSCDYQIYRSLLTATNFDMFEGPTMDKPRSQVRAILTETMDLDGKSDEVWRINLNIREAVADLEAYSPDPGEHASSDPSYDREVQGLWRYYMEEVDGQYPKLSRLFAEEIFGVLTHEQKADNLKLLLALRTKPKTVEGVEILRDMVWVFHTLNPGEGKERERLFRGQFYVNETHMTIRDEARSANATKIEWRSGTSATLLNKKVFHYRPNFPEQFYTEAALEEDILTSFFNEMFKEEAEAVYNSFKRQIRRMLETEDEYVRFLQTYSKLITLSKDIALTVLFPPALYQAFKNKTKDNHGNIIRFYQAKEAFFGNNVCDNYTYLNDINSINFGRIQQIIQDFETFIPQIVREMILDRDDIEISQEFIGLREFVNSSSDIKRQIEAIRSSIVVGRDARWLMRTYFKDADNNIMPAKFTFQKELLQRILGEGKLSDGDLLTKSSEYRLLVCVENAVRSVRLEREKTEDALAVEKITDQEVRDYLRSNEYDIPIFQITRIRKVIAAAQVLLADTNGVPIIGIKNVVRFIQQLEQYQLGCKLINSGRVKYYISRGEIDKFIQEVKQEIKHFQNYHSLKSDTVFYDKSNDDRGTLNLSASDVNMLLNITSMPNAKNFFAFIKSADTNCLDCFAFLKACADDDIIGRKVTTEVLSCPEFTTLMKASVPSLEKQVKFKISTLNNAKKELLERQNKLFEQQKVLHSDVDNPASLRQVKEQVFNELKARRKFVLETIERSKLRQLDGADIRNMTEIELEAAKVKNKYHIARWYESLFLEVSYDDQGDCLIQLREIKEKLVKYLKTVDPRTSFVEDNSGAKLKYRLTAAGINYFIYPTDVAGIVRLEKARAQELTSHLGFDRTKGQYGDKDRIILERRPWFDEYDRDVIKREEGVSVTNRIKELIQIKSRLKSETSRRKLRRDIDALEADIKNGSENFSTPQLLQLIQDDLISIENNINTINDLKLNHSSTFSEQAFILEQLVNSTANNLARLKINGVRKICDVQKVSFRHTNEKIKLSFTKEQIQQLAKFLNAAIEFNKKTNAFQLAILDTNKKLDFSGVDSSSYWCDAKDLIALGIIVDDAGIFYPQQVLTLKVRDEVLARTADFQQEKDQYNAQIDAVWSKYNQDREAALTEYKASEEGSKRAEKAKLKSLEQGLGQNLKELRKQKKSAFFHQVEPIEEGYMMSQQMLKSLIQRFFVRECDIYINNCPNPLSEHDLRIIMQDDQNLSVANIKFSFKEAQISAEEGGKTQYRIHEKNITINQSQGDAGRFVLSYEDFSQLEHHYSFHYDEKQGLFYFGERYIKTLGFAESEPQSCPYDLSDYVSEVYGKLRVLNNEILRLNKAFYQSFINLVLVYQRELASEREDLVPVFDVEKMQRSLGSLERFSQRGTRLIYNDVARFIQFYMQDSAVSVGSLKEFLGNIANWKSQMVSKEEGDVNTDVADEYGMSDCVEDQDEATIMQVVEDSGEEDLNASERDDATNLVTSELDGAINYFLTLAEVWGNSIQKRRDQVLECTKARAAIWQSIEHEEFMSTTHGFVAQDGKTDYSQQSWVDHLLATDITRKAEKEVALQVAR